MQQHWTSFISIVCNFSRSIFFCVSLMNDINDERLFICGKTIPSTLEQNQFFKNMLDAVLLFYKEITRDKLK